MKKIAIASIFIAGLLGLSCGHSNDRYDVLILNGRIVDGTGDPWYYGDVGIRGDKIVAIGKLASASATRRIDASGKIVSPGFIDMLGQSGMSILVDNRAMSKISQGVTTEVTGEGGSVAPVNDRIRTEMAPYLEKYKLTVNWDDFEGYWRRFSSNKSAINLASFVGATQVRAYVVGYDERDPSPQELDQMKELVRDAMKQGALGVSSSLIYAPATYAKTQELIELAKAAAEYGGMYISHIRDEGDEGKEAEAIYEAADIARAAHCSVEIWHLKVAGYENWGKMPDVVRQIESLRREGIDMTADLYPYIASSNSLDATVPGWAHAGGRAKLLERLADKETREKIRAELTGSHAGLGVNFEGILIAQTFNPQLKEFEGKRLNEVAKAWNEDPYDALFDFILKDSSRTGKITFSMSEQDLRFAMGQNWVSFCSDANARATDGPLSEGKPHPRAYGAFVRAIGKYARDEKILTLEEAVRKMTSQPATRVGLKERGILKPGFYADVVVFDPETIADKATFEQPHQYAAGVENVFVNGQEVWEGGKWTGNLPGKPLMGPGYGR